MEMRIASRQRCLLRDIENWAIVDFLLATMCEKRVQVCS